jgi:hypothetical protein
MQQSHYGRADLGLRLLEASPDESAHRSKYFCDIPSGMWPIKNADTSSDMPQTDVARIYRCADDRCR